MAQQRDSWPVSVLSLCRISVLWLDPSQFSFDFKPIIICFYSQKHTHNIESKIKKLNARIFWLFLRFLKEPRRATFKTHISFTLFK